MSKGALIDELNLSIRNDILVIITLVMKDADFYHMKVEAAVIPKIRRK